MAPPSVTSTDSFRLRAQRSEQRRIAVMLAVMSFLLALLLARRLLHDAVMSDNVLFFASAGVIITVIACQAVCHLIVGRATLAGRLLPEAYWWGSASLDVAAPFALLLFLQRQAPAGAVAPLSAPALLVLTVIVLLSTLRLRPAFTLGTGLAVGILHWGLTIHAIAIADPPPDTFPTLFSYGLLLMLFGMGAALVAREVKSYVCEAADEAAAREVARRRIELMERDLSIAREIQLGLIPSSPPKLDDFDIAGMNRPADQTGGDYYDWQTLPDGRVAVVLADVTGHGVGPALVMAVCRAYARASTPVMPQLGPLLQRLNELIYADVGGTRFITFAIALIDPAHSRLELLSAGHGPILWYRAQTRSIESFAGDGVPLGILPEGEFDQPRTLDMSPGDILLMLTDGFFEWQRPGDKEAVGIARIEQLLIQHAESTAADLLRSIDNAVLRFTAGSPQTDDMTAVVVKRR